MSDAAPGRPRPASPRDLFVGFTTLALQGFGGVLPVAQQTLCERKRWLTREEFLEMLAVAQVLPGPNICNLALMVGDRFFGWRGAAAALLGMMLVPMLVVLTVAAIYTSFSTDPMVAGALRGMGAVSAGLIAGTGIKLAASLGRNPLGLLRSVSFAAVAFVTVAWLRAPLVFVLLLLGGLAGALAWVALRAAPADPPAERR